MYSRERSPRSEALEIAVQAAEHEWTQPRQALMLATAETCFEVALAAERLRLLQRQQEAVDKAATEARDRFRLGPAALAGELDDPTLQRANAQLLPPRQ
jgi:outer membrane protein